MFRFVILTLFEFKVQIIFDFHVKQGDFLHANLHVKT